MFIFNISESQFVLPLKYLCCITWERNVNLQSYREQESLFNILQVLRIFDMDFRCRYISGVAIYLSCLYVCLIGPENNSKQ